MDCGTAIGNQLCKADCCGVVPIDNEIFIKNIDKICRDIEKSFIIEDNQIICFTEDFRCIFLNKEFKCNIYDQRPDVCKEYGTNERLPCPYFNIKGRLRSPAKVRRYKRIINHNIDTELKQLKKRVLNTKECTQNVLRVDSTGSGNKLNKKINIIK